MEQGRKHPETLPILARFCLVARKADWRSFHEVRNHFPSADQVGAVLIFDIMGGYRLITRVDYRTQRLFIKALLTHREYGRKEWLKWA